MRISHSQEISMENFLGNVSYHMGIDVCSYPRYFTDNHRTTNRWSFFSYLKRTITIDCITLVVKTHVKLVELNQLHFASILTSLCRPGLFWQIQCRFHSIRLILIVSSAFLWRRNACFTAISASNTRKHFIMIY